MGDVLNAVQRRHVDGAVQQARNAAEQAAGNVLRALAVAEPSRPSYLKDDDNALRLALRVKARQLGDDTSRSGADLTGLMREVAYEQWHRLLFARFLEVNGLLRHPEFRDTSLTLDDCADLADDLGEPDGWSVAARFASEILPGVFRLDDPAVQVQFATEHRLELERILLSIPTEVFVTEDALGWVYQFWQTAEKKRVNESGVKIGGADLSPVTQLFTENYMVRFLLENSVGAWWAARHPDSPLVKTFEYLRFDDAGQPAVGKLGHWPDRVAEITLMDPCCGSGHFLVEAFSMLSQMRAEEERLSLVDAQDAVIRDNLFGLELDARCVQIATFAVALQAWKSNGWRILPSPNIACSGIPVTAQVEEWTRLADRKPGLEGSLKRLHQLFRNADSLGSLINPRRAAEVTDSVGWQRSFEDSDWSDVSAVIDVLAKNEVEDPAIAVLGAAASNLARAADFLSRRYVAVVTNVPYLSRSKQCGVLRNHGDLYYPRSKHDLATMMLERLIDMTSDSVLAVLPQGWTQLSRYRSLREDILSNRSLRMCAFLGAGAFTAISGEVVNAILLAISAERPRRGSAWAAIDVAERRGPVSKAEGLRDGPILLHPQAATVKNPDGRIVPELLPSGPMLAEKANSLYGLRTGDGARLIRKFWEIPAIGTAWRFHQSTTVHSRMFAGREHILRWDDGQGALAQLAAEGIASLQGEAAWGHEGVVVSLMGNLPVARYTGESFDNNCAVVWPKRKELLPALWACLSDGDFAAAVRRIDRSLKVTNQTLLKVPFDIAYWQKRAEETGPLPEPSSDDPTQWLFKGEVKSATQPLQVAVARLLGYRWPEQQTDDLDRFADSDGIAALQSLPGEPDLATRLRELLAEAYGDEWSSPLERTLVTGAGGKNGRLEDWLRDTFFAQHVKIFDNRPFLWHIWDGRKDGFSAIVNYHRLDHRTLEKVTFTSLGAWIERQKHETANSRAGADARLAAAEGLQERLKLILEGAPSYDVYVRWKELHEQPIGWNPDLDDGVRLNIRPFVTAGVLRSKVNVHWKKDRGTNPDGSERINDLHPTLEERREARRLAGVKP